MNSHPDPAATPSTGAASHPDQHPNRAADPSADSSTESTDAPRSVNQAVLHPLQAAQLEHKVEHNPFFDSSCALAGGEKSPQTPLQISPTHPKDAKSAAKPRRSKRRSNHITCRATDDEFDIILRRMALTGESQSEAVRAIIRESENKAGNVYLAPKTPPDHLEALLHALKSWRTAFMATRNRLNVPTPGADDERHAEVKKWRLEAERLLNVIPELEAMARVSLTALTGMTPEKVIRIRKRMRTLAIWKNSFAKKEQEELANFTQDLIDILEAAGITQEK